MPTNPQKIRKKTGRPSKFYTLDLEQIKILYCGGFTDEEVALFCKVDKTTLHRWKLKHPEFCHSLKEWKELADKHIVTSLYHRGRGYSHPAIKFFQYGKKIIKVPYTEHYPPDPTSMIFWLKNRQAGKWKDKHEVDDPAMRELVQIMLPAKKPV